MLYDRCRHWALKLHENNMFDELTAQKGGLLKLILETQYLGDDAFNLFTDYSDKVFPWIEVHMQLYFQLAPKSVQHELQVCHERTKGPVSKDENPTNHNYPKVSLWKFE